MSEALLVVNATAPKYFRGASDLTFRRRLWLALLMESGRVVYNESSTECNWDVEFSEPEVRQYGDAGDQVFNEHDAYRQLTLDWRGYTATDRLTKKKQLMNRSPHAIVNLYRTKSDKLIKSLRHKFCAEMYIDGNAANNDNRLHGIESFMGDDGATVAGDLVANPSDTYAGKNTALADEGGSWSTDLAAADRPNATIATDWPYGNGDTEYDYLAPKLLNYSSTSWNSGGTTWLENCEEVLRASSVWCASLSGDESMPMCHLLSPKLFQDFQNFQAARNRILIPHRMAEDLGFSKQLNFEGAIVKFEFDTPANTGYGLSIEEMELGCLQDQLFVPDGPEWDIKTKGYLFEAGFFGNLRFQPKHFSKYDAYA